MTTWIVWLAVGFIATGYGVYLGTRKRKHP